MSDTTTESRFVVRLAEYGNCWLADWSGDPGRTVCLRNAKTVCAMIRTIKKVDRRRKPIPKWEAPAAKEKTILQRIQTAIESAQRLKGKINA